MVGTALIPWLDPQNLIDGFGAFALLGVAFIVFAETGLLVGFLLPGDTLLVITGILTFTGVIGFEIWWVCLAISFAAFLGGEVGYLIGHKVGPRIFERKETGLFSVENVKRTNAFFSRFGGLAVILARFVPVVRTFAPVAAGVGHMDYRKYSLYNAIGALIWGSGLTFGGYLLGNIPWLRDFIVEYIDFILLAAVTLTVLPTAFHYFRSSHKAKKAREAGRANAISDAEAEKLSLHPKDFDQNLDD
ncbi:DedA family protein [Salinibacterium sp. PAMC 21357]|uniref:DedA family protein n=1 Tax=Salinibacterium sp. PAMC 21357 TaxID=1112215 RepID=UPI000288146A|nr:VTT domain-containing protein [Salinibacterium sp. PAMC 21357]